MAKKRARKLVRVSGWAVVYESNRLGWVGDSIAVAQYMCGFEGRVIPVEIRELPAKKAGGGRKQ